MYTIFIFMSLFVCYLGKSNANIQRRLDGRILGGVDTDISDHPYQVSLQFLVWHVCGGSVMNKYWVITAAHCTKWRNIRPLLKIRAGTSTRESGGTVHEISLIFKHPQYNISIVDYDIAIMKLKNPLVYSNKVKPIRLANVEPSPGTHVIVTGWGQPSESEPSPMQLQKVEVTIISRIECDWRYDDHIITQLMICARAPEGGKDVCVGDSGGPLVAEGYLVGIVSWDAGCGDKYLPGVYSNVALLKEWVEDTIYHYQWCTDNF